MLLDGRLLGRPDLVRTFAPQIVSLTPPGVIPKLVLLRHVVNDAAPGFTAGPAWVRVSVCYPPYRRSNAQRIW